MASEMPTPNVLNKKSSKEHIDVVDEVELKAKYDEGNLDKFGAVIAIDPVERALVKKIDLYMMVRLWFLDG